jgi:hypothetical protein
MSNTRKKYYSKKRKTQTQRKSRASGATMEQIKQNRRRNKMIRNIRMGKIYRGSGQTGGGKFVSQFIGKPWTPDSLGSNYFALSPKGVGTGVVPTFDDKQPLGSARYPTQLGPQLAKLGQAGGGGSKKRSMKNVRGGGFVGDFYDNAKYSLGKLTSRMEGINPPPNPNPYVQPISKNMV